VSPEPQNDGTIRIYDIQETTQVTVMHESPLVETSCDVCNVMGVVQRQKFHHLPDVLLIVLNRFIVADPARGRVIKSVERVRLFKTLTFLNQPGSKPNQKIHYELYGIISHIGLTQFSGHYIAYVKDWHSNWRMFNDDIATSQTLDDILDSLFHDPDGGDHPNTSYVLAYRMYYTETQEPEDVQEHPEEPEATLPAVDDTDLRGDDSAWGLDEFLGQVRSQFEFTFGDSIQENTFEL
jgi:ubiquitin carboxyl-terminal hydrolase